MILNLDYHAVFVALMWLLGVIAADLVMGVLVALKNKQFSWDKLAQFTVTNIPKVFVWLIFVALSAMPVELIPSQYTNVMGSASKLVYLFLMASFIGSLFVHAKELGALSDEFWNAIGIRDGTSKG